MRPGGRGAGGGRASARPRFDRVDNRRVRSLRILVAALGGLLPGVAAAQTLTLQDAIASALAKNRDIVVERESVAQSREGIARAEAAFDPVVRGDTRYRYQKLPAISVLSGAPAGELAPTGQRHLQRRQLLAAVQQRRVADSSPRRSRATSPTTSSR